jgi:cytochrome c5
LKRDQKFFDMYSLVIGLLAIFAIFIFVLSMKMSNVTSDVYHASGEEYRAAVESRLAPFGKVYLPGEELSAGEPQVPVAESAEPVVTAMSGPQVYNAACNVCHGAGIGGAPMLTDSDNWQARIGQGLDVLVDHAVNGFTGSAGYMPPKGGNLALSDEEVRAAVEFMVSEAQGQ